jgi:radical SAM superfamily enzyme YgiQ (UPF0313 family)
MKISLVNPNLSGDVSILDIGLTYLATYINARTQHRADIIDFTFHAKGWQSHLKNKIEKYQPDVIGITCTWLYLYYVKAMAKEIKEKFGISVICGGYQATLDPEEIMGIPQVDAVCIGDGEFVLAEYLDALQEKRLPDGPRKRILFIFNLGWHSALNYEFRIRSMPPFVVCPQEQDHADAHPPGKMNWQQGLLSADYVMDKTGDLGRRGMYEDITSELATSLRNNAQRFKKIGEFKTPDAETVFIYKNTAPVTSCDGEEN